MKVASIVPRDHLNLAVIEFVASEYRRNAPEMTSDAAGLRSWAFKSLVFVLSRKFFYLGQKQLVQTG